MKNPRFIFKIKKMVETINETNLSLTHGLNRGL